jgi:uncharacterized small protein (DUF1192 family)
MPIYIPPERGRRIAALGTEIERARNAIASLTADVDRLDARLQHLTRDRQRGITRDALSILRRAGAPVGIWALTVAVMTEHGQDTADLALVRRNREKLRVCLARQREYGIVRRELGPGRAMVWGVAR